MSDMLRAVEKIRNRLKGLEPHDLLPILDIATQITCKKEQLITTDGTRLRQVQLVLNGVFRTYMIDEDGVEITLSLHRELDFVGTWESILLNQPNSRIIEAVSDGSLLLFDYDRLMEIIDNNPRLQKAYITTIQIMYADTLTMYQTMLNAKPEARYQYIMNWLGNNSHLVPQKHLASFLGITPVSLSRMKRRITK